MTARRKLKETRRVSMGRERLDAAIQDIRDYTSNNQELRDEAHHFVYDLPLDRTAGTPEFVWMGVNPGETGVKTLKTGDWEVPGPTEETWLFAFNDHIPPSRSSKRWKGKIHRLFDGKPVVLAELFFWSASSRDFNRRFGDVWRSPHLDFCTRMNRLLIDEYQPKAVVFTGIERDLTEAVAHTY